jgi:D-alanine-D-alanine ligase
MRDALAAILYGEVPASAPADEVDTLVQARTVAEALRELGWRTADLAVGLDLASAASELTKLSPAFVFNLVETLQGKGRLIAVVPSLLDSLGIPFTGAPTEAVFLTSNKLLGKKILRRAGIPTPPWVEGDCLSEAAAGREGLGFGPPYVLKSVWEHASIGMEDSAIPASMGDLLREAGLRTRAQGDGEFYVEPYVEGREFNLALLGGGPTGEPESLPPAEIDFRAYPEGKPRVVGYRAKWVEGSFEYNNTPRRFAFTPEDAPLVAELVRLARECWRLFGLRGYARVDFRVDGKGRPLILEINTNPCIAPDSGFVAAAREGGMGITEVVRRIVADTLGKGVP